MTRVPGHVVRRIEQLTGLPFWTIVENHACNGESVNSAAKLMGYANPEGLRRLVKKHGKQHLFEGQTRRPTTRQGPSTEAQINAWVKTISEVNARRKARLEFQFEGVTGTLKDHALRKGVNYTTVLYRRKKGWPIEAALANRMTNKRGQTA